MMKAFPLVTLASTLVWSGAVVAQSKYSGEVGASFGYDSGVAVDEIDVSTRRSDHFNELSARFNASYKTPQALKLKAGFSANDKNYNDFSEFDTRTWLVSLGADKKWNKITWGGNFRYADASLGGDDFLEWKLLSSHVSGYIAKQHMLRLDYTHGVKNFERIGDRNGHSNDLGLDYYFFVSGVQRYLTLGINHKVESAVDHEFNYQMFQSKLSYHHRLQLANKKAKLKLSWRYQDKDYRDAVNSIVDEFRHDRRHQYTAQFSLDITESLQLELGYELRHYDSNLPSANYVERMFKSAVNWSF